MKPQIGRYYKTKNGLICGPFEANEKPNNTHYPFTANALTFTANGSYRTDFGDEWDLVEDVTHLFETNPHTFPTWEEYNEFFNSGFNVDTNKVRVYDWFKARIQPLEIGKDYEVSIEQDTWFRDTFKGYETSRVSQVHHIRPIQKTKRERTIEALKAMEQTDAIKDAIKLLEEK